MTSCPDPEFTWPQACTITPRTPSEEFGDNEPWYIARALYDTTIALLDTDCHAQPLHPIVIGLPVTDKGCCGQIKVGINPTFTALECFKPKHYEWHVLVSWKPGSAHSLKQSSDIEYLRRELTEQACCLLEGQGVRRALHVARPEISTNEHGDLQVVLVVTNQT